MSAQSRCICWVMNEDCKSDGWKNMVHTKIKNTFAENKHRQKIIYIALVHAKKNYGKIKSTGYS